MSDDEYTSGNVEEHVEYEEATVSEGMSEDSRAPGFFSRIAALPLSKAAVEQLSVIYEKASQRKVLSMGLSAGEYTFKLAGKVATVASPVLNKLPVNGLDYVACKQLDMVEYIVPVITREPREIKEVTGELYQKAKAMPSASVKMVTDTGYNTAYGVKNYAVETITPTVNRVQRASTYGKDQMSRATTYTKEKLGGVKTTYDRSGEYLTSIKTSVGNKYEGLKGGVAYGYGSTVSGMRNAKDEVINYACETCNPTIERCKAAKNYGVEKGTHLVSQSYTGIKERSIPVIDYISNTRIVKYVQSTRVAQAAGRKIDGAVNYATVMLDNYLPPPEDFEEIDPADPDAGTWTKTMRLLYNLRVRGFDAGRRKLKPVVTWGQEMGSTLKGYSDSTSQAITKYYHFSLGFLTKVYTIPVNCVGGTLRYGRDFSINIYRAAQDRYNGLIKPKASALYCYTVTKLVWVKDTSYSSVQAVPMKISSVKEVVSSKIVAGYGYIQGIAISTKDFFMDKLGMKEKME